MTREDFLAFLVRLVRDRAITERRAAELLLAFDSGTLRPEDLPEQEDSNLVPVLFSVSASLIILLRRLGYSTELPLVIPASAQGGIREALRIEFQQQSRRLARLLQQSSDVSAWQSGMADLIKRNMVENAVAGAGRILTLAELRALEPLAQEQMAFLARFADQIALRNLTGDPMSEAAIAARSELYGRMGLALDSFFEEQAADYGAGWVVDYISMDDRGVCSNCLDAEARGPYLPGQGVYPGEICYGGMRCRCRREARFDPAVYEALTGTRAA